MDFLQTIRKYWACTKNSYFDQKRGKKLQKFTQIKACSKKSYIRSKVRQQDPEIHANTNPVLKILFQIKSEAKRSRNLRKY